MNFKFNLFRSFGSCKAIVLVPFVFLFFSVTSHSQSYVTWNSATYGATMAGTFTGGSVTLSSSGGGTNVSYFSPSDNIFGGGQVNLQATGSQTLGTLGSSSSPTTNSITFTFSTPVIINRLNIADIDFEIGGGNDWNDSLTFSGVTFSSASNVNCSVNNSGVVSPGTNLGQNSEYASWFTSTAAVSSFTINFQVSAQNTTTAFLAYSMQVSLPVACAANAGTLTLN